MSNTLSKPWRGSAGMTLIELLMVISIIGLLVQLLLPAIGSSREAANQLSCTNNLKQIALAIQLHHDAHKRLPSGGWHYTWAGEPELGTGPQQPGGWIFNVLPYIEYQDLRDRGKELTEFSRADALMGRSATPIPLFYCPSRRLAKAYPVDWSPWYYSRDGLLNLQFELGAKSDFAACIGGSASTADYFELVENGAWQPPESLTDVEEEGYLWPDDPEFAEKYGAVPQFDGVIYGRSRVRYDQITDGLSKTYLVGEKYLAVKRYGSGHDPGDQEHMYAGFNDDTQRSADLLPVRDTLEDYHHDQFGSPHPSSWNMAFVDGSVHPLTYDLFLEVHRRLGSRNDGQPVTHTDL